MTHARTLIALAAACLSGAAPLAAQASTADSLRFAFTGTWFLATPLPAYTSSPGVPPSSPRSPARPVLVPRDRVVFSGGPIPVPHASDPNYPRWVEMNPRDSIVIAVSDSAVSITAGGIPAMIWLTDGKERREVNHDGSSYRTKADWKKDVLSTARGEPGLPMIERRLRMTRDGTIEMTFPGVIRARNYPSKLVFTRNRAVP